MYPYFDGVPERIANVIPDVKLIYVLRDPVERMRSMYVQLLARWVRAATNGRSPPLRLSLRRVEQLSPAAGAVLRLLLPVADPVVDVRGAARPPG